MDAGYFVSWFEYELVESKVEQLVTLRPVANGIVVNVVGLLLFKPDKHS